MTAGRAVVQPGRASRGCTTGIPVVQSCNPYKEIPPFAQPEAVAVVQSCKSVMQTRSQVVAASARAAAARPSSLRARARDEWSAARAARS